MEDSAEPPTSTLAAVAAAAAAAANYDSDEEEEENANKRKEILKRIPQGAEATAVLVGCVDFVTTPIMAFVRLAQGQMLHNLTEVPLPVRFIFVLLGPEVRQAEFHEIGRSMSTLMTNKDFHEAIYQAEDRREIQNAINEFLDESTVLPPGELDRATLLPLARMEGIRKRRKSVYQSALPRKDFDDPLKRTGCLFGGVFRDIKRRFPKYKSDITDSLHQTCVVSFIFTFIACIAEALTFGGILSNNVDGLMGVSETLLGTALTGIIFSLASGQPIMILGLTGPFIVFEGGIYEFCTTSGINFMAARCWVGLWVSLITLALVAVEGSFLIHHLSRFSEEIFSCLISIIFLYEVGKKIYKIYKDHPLMEFYPPPLSCNFSSFDPLNSENATSPLFNGTLGNQTLPESCLLNGVTKNRPNTFLLSLIMIFGTFFMARFLKHVRGSHYLGRTMRRALGDYGMLISIMLMVVLDYWLGTATGTYTEKVQMSESFQPTSSKRGWFINPLELGLLNSHWVLVAAFIPAVLVFILLFIEIELTGILLSDPSRGMTKGTGFHLDLLISGVLITVCSLLGLPWMCAAPVQTMTHYNSLLVMSTTHAPGEKPTIVEVREQRVTNFLVHIFIGLTMFSSAVFKLIPMSVLFGVFLYMGIVSLFGVQLFKRFKLLFIPSKHHPDLHFVRKVQTGKMHLFTLIQLVLLSIFIYIKTTSVAFFFPCFLILLVPIRKFILPRMFHAKELEELDKQGEDEEDFLDGDDDEYDHAQLPV